MKVFSAIVKIVVALAAIAGAVYVAATYGDQIVAWCKKMVSRFHCCCGSCEDEEVTVEVEVIPEEEPIAEETANEADFEG